jgi:AhpD family alkylhydroperoxidase
MTEPCACSEGLFTPVIGELVAIAAAIAANCEPCFKYHYAKAKELGASDEDIAKAVGTANAVKEVPAAAVLRLANIVLGKDCTTVKTFMPASGTCCQSQADSSKCCEK